MSLENNGSENVCAFNHGLEGDEVSGARFRCVTSKWAGLAGLAFLIGSHIAPGSCCDVRRTRRSAKLIGCSIADLDVVYSDMIVDFSPKCNHSSFHNREKPEKPPRPSHLIGQMSPIGVRIRRYPLSGQTRRFRLITRTWLQLLNQQLTWFPSVQ